MSKKARFAMLLRRLAIFLLIIFWQSRAAAAEGAPAISGPDGPRVPRPSKAPRSRPLKEWMEERRKQREDAEEEDAQKGDGLPSQVEGAVGEKQDPKPKEHPQLPATAYLRWDLGLIYPKILSSRIKWSAEPGIRLLALGRISTPGAQPSLWVGFRALSFAAQGTRDSAVTRVGRSYFGPVAAWEWLHFSDPEADSERPVATSRQRVALGLAALSQIAERGVGDQGRDLSNRSFGTDGPGLWAEYTYARNVSSQCEWDINSGIHLGAQKIVLYIGAGFSLWLGEKT